MKRLLGLAGGLVLALGALVPAALADDGLTRTGRLILVAEGDAAIPAGEHADAVIVISGNADIRGEVNDLVVIDGTATLTGATVETVVAIGSQVELATRTVVLGEVQRLDSTVHQSGDVEIQGGIVDLGSRLMEIGSSFAPAFALLWLGFALSTVVAGLFVAAIAGRQLRAAERLISREPVLTGATGLLSVILIPLVAVLLFPTIVGVALGLGILFVLLPMIAFAGYLVATVWVGDFVLRLGGAAAERERPYLETVVGIVVLGVAGLVPVLGLVVAIASLFGFGAVVLAAIRTISGGTRSVAGTPRTLPIPTGA